jgi:hypothetical protein
VGRSIWGPALGARPADRQMLIEDVALDRFRRLVEVARMAIAART